MTNLESQLKSKQIRSVGHVDDDLYILTNELNMIQFRISQMNDVDGDYNSVVAQKVNNQSDIVGSDHIFNSNYELLHDKNQIYIFTKRKLYLKMSNQIQDISLNNLIIR